MIALLLVAGGVFRGKIGGTGPPQPHHRLRDIHFR
jgi:hypothetical protein